MDIKIEELIVQDIQRELETVKSDLDQEWLVAAHYHLQTTKSFCNNLIGRLDEKIEELEKRG